LATFHEIGLPRALFVHVSNLEESFPKFTRNFLFFTLFKEIYLNVVSSLVDGVTNTDSVFLSVLRLVTNRCKTASPEEKRKGNPYLGIVFTVYHCSMDAKEIALRK